MKTGTKARIWICKYCKQEFIRQKIFVCIGRCRWKTFKSLEYEQKRKYILELVTKIQKLIL